MKFNEFDIAMNFRYNLSMYMLLIYLLGGKLQDEGISIFSKLEAVVSGQTIKLMED